MPDIILTTSMENVQRIIAMIESQFPRLDGESDLDLGKRFIKNFIKQKVYLYERKTAVDSAMTSVVPDDNIIT